MEISTLYRENESGSDALWLIIFKVLVKNNMVQKSSMNPSKISITILISNEHQFLVESRVMRVDLVYMAVTDFYIQKF